MSKTLWARAKAGALFLDSIRPGWANMIDWYGFDMELEDECVLGQLYDDYAIGVSALRLSMEEEEQLGFVLPRPMGGQHTYADLSLAWRAHGYERLVLVDYQLVEEKDEIYAQ